MEGKLLELKKVSKIFYKSGILNRRIVKAVDEVSFDIGSEPEVVALVGESGCGKTTICRLILGLETLTSGDIIYKGKSISKWLRENPKDYRKEVQIIFQDPYETFNPFYRVDRLLSVAVKKFGLAQDQSTTKKLIFESLEAVGLRPKELLGRYPHQLSGGERQRFMLARIYLIEPKLLVADEPVSMLDASLRAMFLDHLKEFKRIGISSLYITHDLNTANYIADRIIIIYAGKVVEKGPTEAVINDPLHPYTKDLITAIPIPDPKKRWKEKIEISKIKLSERINQKGCYYYNRCKYRMPKCETSFPPEFEVDGRKVSCFQYE
ncbi:MAG TPA: ABC transporter ATP-binding protein [Thermotogaceae bacterium]|nr:ABC transporter ATP-binding protein [Thermotogaceae bacterium]